MRTNLAEEPEVIAVACAVGLAEDHVVGKLHKLWSWADAHTVDGTAKGLYGDAARMWVDRYLACEGIADALINVGWLSVDEGLGLPNFGRHNGLTAKKRIETAARVAKHRCNGDVTQSRYINASLRKKVLKRDGAQCRYCGRKEGEVSPNEPSSEGRLSVDHIIPLTRGGDTSADNLVVCCVVCNRLKGDRTPDEAGMILKQQCNKKVLHPLLFSSLTLNQEKKEGIAVPEVLDTEAFQEAWQEWVNHRREIGKKLTALSVKKQLKELASIGHDRAIAMIEHTIAKGWTGLREADESKKTKRGF